MSLPIPILLRQPGVFETHIWRKASSFETARPVEGSAGLLTKPQFIVGTGGSERTVINLFIISPCYLLLHLSAVIKLNLTFTVPSRKMMNDSFLLV